MVKISPECINCFKWDRILQRVLWLNGHKLILASAMPGWWVLDVGWEVQGAPGGAGGIGRYRGNWEVQGALGHCPVPHTVNLQPSSPELCSHPSGLMSHLQPRLASSAREQIPNSQQTAFPWRFPLLILMSKRGVNKLAKQKEGQQPSHIPLCWFVVHLSSVPPLGSVLVGLTSAVHI